MSTVTLLKDHPTYGKAGTRNTKVPYLDANRLVSEGYATRGGAGGVPAGGGADPLKAKVAALEAENAALRQQNKELGDLLKAADEPKPAAPATPAAAAKK